MKKNNAFTLIEVLVVIAILAGLVAILFPNFMSIREKARDTQRKNDIKQLQKALELYKENSYPPAYPTALPNPCQAFTNPSDGTQVFMSKIPGDPMGNCTTNIRRYFYYRWTTDPLKYELRACLEDKQDVDGTSSQTAPYFDTVGYTCSPVWLYTVTEP